MRLPRTAAPVATLAAVAAVLAGCGITKDNDAALPQPLHTTVPTSTPPATSGNAIAVAASDSACTLDKSSIDAGPVTLHVHNGGSKVTEVYILKGADGTGGIVTERENIGPNSDADVVSELAAGSYTISCRPQDSERINTGLTVNGGASAAPTSATAAGAVSAYREYVAQQVHDTIEATQAFVDALKAGDLAKAKERFAPSRQGWEAIEPVAEAFGDIDPKTDTREADLEAGQTWTGWHKIEKVLWVDGTTQGTGPLGDDLLANLNTLKDRVPTADITPTSMANGAKELLDEVATGKITGEEDIFSHTDLWDFKANLDGAKKVYELLKPLVRDSELTTTLDTEFADAEAALNKYKVGSGWEDYSKVDDAGRKALSDAVNALAEPLSKLAAAVVSA
jgi:iron uptake system component EfeO